MLIVDEPFLGLDTLAQKAVTNLLRQQAKAGRSVLMTTHLLTSAAQFVDKFIVLHEGHVYFEGSPKALAKKYGLAMTQLDDFFDLIQGAGIDEIK